MADVLDTHHGLISDVGLLTIESAVWMVVLGPVCASHRSDYALEGGKFTHTSFFVIISFNVSDSTTVIPVILLLLNMSMAELGCDL